MAPLRQAPVAAPAPTKVAVVVNPFARRAHEALAAIGIKCRALGIDAPRTLFTTESQPGAQQARIALDEGADLVVAMGGDGTVREVAKVLEGTDATLGILPRGSGNVLAHNLHLPTDLAGSVEVALVGDVATIDVGHAELTTVHGTVQHEIFTTMVGIGRDAEAVKATRYETKRYMGWVAYAAQGTKAALSPALEMEVGLDGGPLEPVSTWTVLVGMTPTTPGGLTIYPKATLDDGLLHVLRVPINHPIDWLRAARIGLITPNGRTKVLDYTDVRELVVRPSRPQAAQLDGDVVDEVVEMRAWVEPCNLKVRVG